MFMELCAVCWPAFILSVSEPDFQCPITVRKKYIVKTQCQNLKFKNLLG